MRDEDQAVDDPARPPAPKQLGAYKQVQQHNDKGLAGYDRQEDQDKEKSRKRVAHISQAGGKIGFPAGRILSFQFSNFQRRFLQNICQHALRRAPAQLCFWRDQQTVGQDRGHQILDIIRDDVIATADGRQRLGGLEQRQAGARAGAQYQVGVLAGGW